jgi:hypothetical protein
MGGFRFTYTGILLLFSFIILGISKAMRPKSYSALLEYYPVSDSKEECSVDKCRICRMAKQAVRIK